MGRSTILLYILLYPRYSIENGQVDQMHKDRFFSQATEHCQKRINDATIVIREMTELSGSSHAAKSICDITDLISLVNVLPCFLRWSTSKISGELVENYGNWKTPTKQPMEYGKFCTIERF